MMQLKKYFFILWKALYRKVLLFCLPLILITFITKDQYVNFLGYNIGSKEKIFLKDNKKVVLIGMVHVGNYEFYTELDDNYSKCAKCLILREGIGFDSDETITYSELASSLGLVSQPRALFKYNYISADIHSDDLSEDTKDFLSLSLELINSLSDFDNFSEVYTKLNDRFHSGIPKSIKYDIIDKRNQHLMSIFDLNSKHKNIIIPWGAAHLNDIEQELLKRGYELHSSSNRIVLNIPKSLLMLVGSFF